MIISIKAIPRIKILAKNCQYKKILNEFLEVTRTSEVTHKQNTHGVEHVIKTMSPLVSVKARQLCSKKLKAATKEFEYMMQ